MKKRIYFNAVKRLKTTMHNVPCAFCGSKPTKKVIETSHIIGGVLFKCQRCIDADADRDWLANELYAKQLAEEAEEAEQAETAKEAEQDYPYESYDTMYDARGRTRCF